MSNTKKEKITFDLIKQVWSLYRPFKKIIIAAVIWVSVMEVINLADPYIFKLVIDEITNWGPGSPRSVINLAVLMLVINVFATHVLVKKKKYFFDVLLEVERFAPMSCHQKLLEQPVGYHVENKTGEKISKITRGVWKLSDIGISVLEQLLPTVIRIIVTFSLLLVLKWQIAVIFIAVLPLYLWQSSYIDKRIAPIRKVLHDIYEYADNLMTQANINILTVQSNNQEKNEFAEYKKAKDDLFEKEQTMWHKLCNFDYIRANTVSVARVAVLVACVWHVANGSITLGTLVLFLTLSEKVYFSLYSLSVIYERIENASESVKRMTKIIEDPVAITSKPYAVDLKDSTGCVEFENVHFGYNGSDRVISGIDLQIDPGKTYGIVGGSGGGKTRLIQRLHRQYGVRDGSIRIDGHDLRDIAIPSLRQTMAVVSQDVEMFDRSLSDNIRYGRPEATDDEVLAAARLANVDEFAERLGKGYDTLIGENGVRLSGGQRQRVGIARAAIRNPAILILDEATSSLDSETERLIQEALQEVIRNRTTIIIAHRLSTIRRADEIVVVEGGVIVEQGTHAELVARDGRYTEMVRTQQDGFVL